MACTPFNSSTGTDGTDMVLLTCLHHIRSDLIRHQTRLIILSSKMTRTKFASMITWLSGTWFSDSLPEMSKKYHRCLSIGIFDQESTNLLIVPMKCIHQIVNHELPRTISIWDQIIYLNFYVFPDPSICLYCAMPSKSTQFQGTKNHQQETHV